MQYASVYTVLFSNNWTYTR